MKRAGALARTSEHDRPIFMLAGPDGSRPRCGGRDSRVGGPGDYPRCFSQECTALIDGPVFLYRGQGDGEVDRVNNEIVPALPFFFLIV